METNSQYIKCKMMDIDDNKEKQISIEHHKTKKYKPLRKVLKDYIINFLDFSDIFGNLFTLDKEFISIIQKNEYFNLFISIKKSKVEIEVMEKENFLSSLIDKEVYEKHGKELESYLILLKYKNSEMKKIKTLNTKKFCKVYLSKEIFHKHLVLTLIKYLKNIETIFFQKNIKKSFTSEFIDCIREIMNVKAENIKTYDFTGNYIGYINLDLLTKFLEMISCNKDLRVLNLSKNYLGLCSENVKLVQKIFEKNENIEELNLSSNDIGSDNDIYFTFLWKIIEKNNRIKILNLSSNYIGDHKTHFFGIRDAFKINKTLHTLNLSNNYVNKHQKSFKTFLNALVDNNLKTLDLSKITLGSTEESLKEFSNFLGQIKNSTIENLFLSENSIGKIKSDEILQSFFLNLKQLRSIKSLKLDNNDASYNYLFLKNFNLFLLENNIIKELDISSNDFGLDKDNIQSLFALLAKTNIKNLNLSNNQLANGDDVFCYFIEYLSIENKVISLDLRYNSFGEKTDYFEVISKELQINQSLQIVNLSNNKIEEKEENIVQLNEILKNNKNIKQLIIKINQISNIKSKSAMKNAIKNNDIRLIYQ